MNATWSFAGLIVNKSSLELNVKILWDNKIIKIPF